MIADARLTLDFGGGGKPLDDRIREFTCGAGRVRLWSPQAYVGYAVYSGVIKPECFLELRSHAVEFLAEARLAIFDYSRAVLALQDVLPAARPSAACHNPAAVVVRPEHYAMAKIYSDKMAELGIMRCVFLPGETERVRRFVATLTGTQAHEERLQFERMPAL